MVGRSNQKVAWAARKLRDADSRVRANAVECLSGLAGDDAKGLFHEAAAEPAGRVAANAMLGLYYAQLRKLCGAWWDC